MAALFSTGRIELEWLTIPAPVILSEAKNLDVTLRFFAAPLLRMT